MSKLEKKIKNKEFVITSEITPPKGINYEVSLNKVANLKDRIDAVNVTDQQSSIMSLGSLVMSYFVLKQGIEPIYQITCRDRNRIALESDLLSAGSLGIENVLVLTGDHPKLGDHPQTKPVYDLDSIQLLKVISKLESGYDISDNKLKGTPKFFTGAVVNPGVDILDLELIKMEKKISSGAKFFQTQAIYDLKLFEKFIKKASGFKIPILAGVIPIKSMKMAEYLSKNVAGIHIPETYLEKLKKSKDFHKDSINLTVELIKEFRNMVQGVHIMPIAWTSVVKKILDNLN